MDLEKIVEKEKIPVRILCGPKKKGRKWARNLPESGLMPLVTGVFSDLKDKEFHLEYADGVWIEDDGDWEMALEWYDAEKPDRLELKVVCSTDIPPEQVITQSATSGEPPAKRQKLADGSAKPIPFKPAPKPPSVPNPYATTPQASAPNPYAASTASNPYAAPQAPNPYSAPSPYGHQAPVAHHNPYAAPAASNPFAAQHNPYGHQPQPRMNHEQKMESMLKTMVNIMHNEGRPMNVLKMRALFPGEKPRRKDLNFLLYREQGKGKIIQVENPSFPSKPMWKINTTGEVQAPLNNRGRGRGRGGYRGRGRGRGRGYRGRGRSGYRGRGRGRRRW